MRLRDLHPDEARNVAALLDEGLDLSPERRVAWQENLNLRAPNLGVLIAELLKGVPDSTAGARNSVAHETERVAGAVSAALEAGASLQGRHFGPYRVERLLGRGGMGTVWLAERADGLFARQVALKLPHASLAGGALLERFARERSILAALAHPLIARLLDAGVAEDGQPYLAIEYVEGKSLTAYCDENRLTLSARIALVMQVLAAVQHAHRNLVIHRDLKPTNILVTREGHVRLLDFGIAKLVTDGEVLETDLTQRGGRALTLEYASPEQIAGRQVTTSSDVYSLGVLLYTLLCGHRPFQLERDSRGALEEAILSAQPIRPSQQVPTRAITDARATTPKALVRALAGDLDTIVLKAIKKHPAERYATADALMQDLQCYLSGEPVQARPDSLTYRCAKFIRRNRVGLAVAALLLVVIVLGVAGTLSQASRAEQQALHARQARDAALKELAFAEASEAFMRIILRDMSGKAFTPAELLTRADAIVDAQYSNDAALRSRMQLVLADLFTDQCNSKSYHEVPASHEAALAQPVSAARPSTMRKLFLCVHEVGKDSMTANLAATHEQELRANGQHGVDYKAYWVDEKQGRIYSLAEAPSAEATEAVYKQVQGLVHSTIMEVTSDNMNWTPTPGRKLYMDVHHVGPGKITAKDVAAAHERDLAVEPKYNVRYLNYWFDAVSGTIRCLAEAPSAAAAQAVHEEAHNFLPQSIAEVSEGRY